MSEPSAAGYAPVNGMQLYWERHGQGGTPLIMVHGGFGLASSLYGLIDTLGQARQVIAIELQGHGHTRDIERPFRYEDFGDDIAALAEHLGLDRVDLFGYSLGTGACLRAAIQHPRLVRKLVVVSGPCRREGWFPEVRAAFDQMSRAGFEALRQSPMYAAWLQVAPDPDAFPTLMDKTGDLQRTPYDWSGELGRITAETLLVFADADSFPLSHVAEFYGLLGGGLRDAGWDGSGRARCSLAVLPGTTHYDITQSPQLAPVVASFLQDSDG